jgi:type I restriction enzyme M protein
VLQNSERENALWNLSDLLRGYLSDSQKLLISYCYIAWKIKDIGLPLQESSLFEVENEGPLSRIALSEIESISSEERHKLTNDIFELLGRSSYEDYVYYCTHYSSDFRYLNMAVSAPDGLMELACRILEIVPTDKVFDLGSGYGNFLAYAGQYCFENDGKYPSVVGQEIDQDIAEYSKMILSIMGIDYQIESSNSLYSYAPSYTKAYVFPPCGLKYNQDMLRVLNTLGKDHINARTSSEWMFVLKALEGLKPGFVAVALLPTGTLFRLNDQSVREYLLRKRLVSGVINLPSGILGVSGIATSMVVFKCNSDFVKILDASSIIGKVPSRLSDTLIPSDRIYKAYNAPEVYKANPLELVKNDSNLSVSSILSKDIELEIDCPKKLCEVAEVLRGSQYTISKFQNFLSAKPTKYQILTSSNIEGGLIDFESLQYINNDDPKLEKFALKEGDLVVTSKSSKIKMCPIVDLEGRTVIVTGGMLIIRPNKNKLDSSYLKMFLESQSGQATLRAIQKGVTIVSINAQDLEKITISCPSMDKQLALSNKYNSLVATYDGMRKDMLALESQIKSLFDDNSKESK